MRRAPRQRNCRNPAWRQAASVPLSASQASGTRMFMTVRQTMSVRGGSWIAILLFALIALVPTERASAAVITYQSVTGSWHDAVDNVPGSQPGDPVITNGIPTSSINWGTTTGAQSGYDFTG